ncbi:hypothetical protein Q5H92_12325 [Hymenobacter sp. M29]|uniref:DUF3592 domain-containing protein n=1 Tax=Hymenobacter mellowenesis TaxID=3063995 RepID=A0ABT9ABE8_9BACT|nr:hypothetical protein [Hymenobacter sp. M29]MDO7847149.1 hypothetical protein [Hymenobacter sp. M29]
MKLALGALLAAILLSVGGFSLWLSHQALHEQRLVAGTVLSLTRNQARSRGNTVHYELEIRLQNQPFVFLIPVRYEPAIPDVVKYVQPGDSITAFYSPRGLPSSRSSIDLIHLEAHGRVLLDFHEVQAASRRTAVICMTGAGVNILFLLLASRRSQLKRWWRRTRNSRRFFA